MPFQVIRGTFRLLNRTKAGNATGFQPDGDSMQFRPDNVKLLDRLRQLSFPYKLTAIGSVQLRFEGIDALELHYTPSIKGSKQTRQPPPFAEQARDTLTSTLRLDPVQYGGTRGIRVQPPAIRDGARGYILSRSLEVKGRPVSFVFIGDPRERDGTEVHLSPAFLRRSVNYKLVAAGMAYPLFYETLFADLRAELAQAAVAARSGRMGLWRRDRSVSGCPITTQSRLEAEGIVFPKLFRRITDYLATPNRPADFLKWLREKHLEQVITLDRVNTTHFDNVLKTRNRNVAMTYRPDNLVFISAK
jgi:endonuclease YncB( thermonuclease family)